MNDHISTRPVEQPNGDLPPAVPLPMSVAERFRAIGQLESLPVAYVLPPAAMLSIDVAMFLLEGREC